MATAAPPDEAALAGPTPAPTVRSEASKVREAALLMYASFDLFEGTNANAITRLGNLGYEGAIIPLAEISRFVFLDKDVERLGEALRKLTGESFRGDDWQAWYRWLGEHPEIEAVPGYASWKGQLYGAIDERFREFFYDAKPTRIPFWTVQWGGVGFDGIPPLDNPATIPGAEADYLAPDDPVFGVSINGEARAYPWRIMAWHELANDVIGGKPVTFVF